jgi:hypothetical protein
VAKLTKRIDDLKSELMDEIHQIHDRISNLETKITEEAKVEKLPPPKVFKRATYDDPVTFFNDSILIGTQPDTLDWLLPYLPRFESV